MAASSLVYEKVNRSVVNITTRSVRPDAFLLTHIPSEGAVSDLFLDRDVHVLTNHHVVVREENEVQGPVRLGVAE